MKLSLPSCVIIFYYLSIQNITIYSPNRIFTIKGSFTTMKNYLLALAILLVSLLSITSFADTKKINVKEVSVFKDGHVFVLHEGVLPTDKDGNILIDYLPNPILGTFWPYSADTNAKLVGVVTGRKKIAIERTALDIETLLAANIGAEVLITEKPLYPNNSINSYSATILSIPTRSSEELAATSEANSLEQLPEKAELVLLKTSNGTKVLSIKQIQDITFKNSFNSKLSEEEFRNQMTLKLDWGKQKSAHSAQVGLVYIQKGIRWIPSYKINLDGNGNAVVKLQATLLNELTDLNDVTVNLVVGVPTFAFKDTIDPIALQQATAQLSRYFDNNQARGLSNNIAISGVDNNDVTSQRVINSQVTRSSTEASEANLGPDIPNSGQTEDLYVFKLKNISIKKGERMVFTITEQTLKYKDVYTLDIPFVPPAEVTRNISSQQQLEIAKAMREAKAIHKIRITNSSNYPFTTAPALITSNDTVLAEGLLTYTAIGATTDLEITKAINILTKKTDTETKRTPNAVHWQGNDYAKIDLSSSIKLTNLYKQPVYLEINRYVLGAIDTTSNNPEVKNINVLEDEDSVGVTHIYGSYSYNWPDWWFHFNGVGKITWKVTLEPGKNINFDYSWHYFAR